MATLTQRLEANLCWVFVVHSQSYCFVLRWKQLFGAFLSSNVLKLLLFGIVINYAPCHTFFKYIVDIVIQLTGSSTRALGTLFHKMNNNLMTISGFEPSRRVSSLLKGLFLAQGISPCSRTLPYLQHCILLFCEAFFFFFLNISNPGYQTRMAIFLLCC